MLKLHGSELSAQVLEASSPIKSETDYNWRAAFLQQEFDKISDLILECRREFFNQFIERFGIGNHFFCFTFL